jgi:hypothetical protein
MKNKITSRSVLVALAFCLATTFVMAAPKPSKDSQPVAPFPGTLVNARYVYVTSYDGDQFNPNLLPEDRQAIGAVQDAIQKWGHFTIVYEPGQADMVLMVTSRPSEDLLAIYDAHGWPGTEYLWRRMGRNGLQKNETPFMNDLQKAFDQATAKR